MTKFLIGTAATATLAWLFHGPLGYGQAFIDDLARGSSAALSKVEDADGVMIAMDQENALRRVAILSGNIGDPERRERIRQAVLTGTPGLMDARWAPAKTRITIAPDTGKPATVEQVKDCQADVDTVIKGHTINFTSGGSLISAESVVMIDALAGALAACQGTRVAVEGHTDARGGAKQNQRLSEERANSVVAALVDLGIPSTRLLPKGFGETKLLDTSGTIAADAKNRRIDFAVAAAPSTAPAR
jgi:OmpA-OmpF porin, OOP family